MQIDDISRILTNRIATLEMNKSAAFQTGDLDAYNRLDLEIIETKNSLEQLSKLNVDTTD